jgi:hypothetical protein
MCGETLALPDHINVGVVGLGRQLTRLTSLRACLCVPLRAIGRCLLRHEPTAAATTVPARSGLSLVSEPGVPVRRDGLDGLLWVCCRDPRCIRRMYGVALPPGLPTRPRLFTPPLLLPAPLLSVPWPSSALPTQCTTSNHAHTSAHACVPPLNGSRRGVQPMPRTRHPGRQIGHHAMPQRSAQRHVRMRRLRRFGPTAATPVPGWVPNLVRVSSPLYYSTVLYWGSLDGKHARLASCPSLFSGCAVPLVLALLLPWWWCECGLRCEWRADVCGCVRVRGGRQEDCLNGTVYKTLDNLDPKDAEGLCCAACSADPTTCAGWNMPQGDNGTKCQLMKEPLVMWNGGQDDSKCKAAEVDHSKYKCWYSNPQYANFAPFCNRSECTCDVIDNHLAVGLEADAMCHEDSMSRRSLERFALKPAASAAAVTPDYWQCSDAVSEACFNG